MIAPPAAGRPAPITVAIIGLGRIGHEFHLARCLRDPRFKLVAVVDKEAGRRREAVAACPETECASFPDADSLFAAGSDSLDAVPDVVVVALPTALHCELTVKALRRGSHVVLEKPMAPTVAAVDEIAAAAAAASRQVFVFQPHRWTAESVTAEEVLASGKLGPLFCIKRTYSCYRRRNDWQSLQQNHGGMLFNYGAHYVDQLLCLSGFAPLSSVHCHLWAAATRGDADDVVKLWLRTETGVLLDMEINEAAALDLSGTAAASRTVLGEAGRPAGRQAGRQRPLLFCCLPLSLPDGSFFWCVRACAELQGKYGTAVLDTASTDPVRAFRLRYYRPAEAINLPVEADLAAPGRSYAPGDHSLPWVEEQLPLRPIPEPALPESSFFYDNVHDCVMGVAGATPLVALAQARQVISTLERAKAVGNLQKL
eukprot:SAG22_NODE_1429_length_4441_cov_39.877476_2_plen_426_part_00